MDPKDNIYRMLRCGWYNPLSDAWTCWPVNGYKWVPMVIYITSSNTKDAIVINNNDLDRLLDLLKKHIVYCTPDIPTRYNITCDKIVDKAPDDVFVIALPP
jgi:hypothetical protein